MTLAEAERYLLSLELFGMRFGLDRMRRLMTALGSPQEQFGSIHVVGTNGKSSTTRMIAAILRRHGLRSGAYLSPHLTTFAERIRVDDADVSPEAFGAAVARARAAAAMVDRTLDAGDRVTQFEALTAAAYWQLAQAGVEVAVIEAGLGGRWDATNVIPSRVQVLTNVGLEHTRWLGPTVADIAEEKVDVVREHGTLVVGAGLHPDALAVAERVCGERSARLVVASAEPGVEVVAGGAFQRRNFALARAAAGAYLDGALDEAAVAAAAASTLVPGRFEIVGEGAGGDVVTVLDGAHNPGGMVALAEALQASPAAAASSRASRCSTTRTPPRCSARCSRSARRSSAPPARTRGPCRPRRCSRCARSSTGRRPAPWPSRAPRWPPPARPRARAAWPWPPDRSTSSPTCCAPSRRG